MSDPATPDVPEVNPTLTRRRQRRPQLQSEVGLPEELSQRLVQVQARLQPLCTCSDVADERNKKAMRTVCEALRDMVQTATTPELQLRAVSRITGSLREVPLGTVAAASSGGSTKPTTNVHSPSEQVFMDVLMCELVFPFLMDCRVRYLHRALTTLLRTTYELNEAAVQQVETAFLAMVHRITEPDPSAGRPSLFPRQHSDTESYKSRVMYFLNCVDGLAATLMTLTPAVFLHTFLEVLPLLGDCLQWAVENAVTRRRVAGHKSSTASIGDAGAPSPEQEEGADGNAEGETTDDGSGTVFGEDLEHVRFCVRVVATYTHKHMTRRMDEIWLANDDPTTADAMQCLSRLLIPTFVMLTTDIFPKDVLNAAGLLLASVLTVRVCDPWRIRAVCRLLCGSSPESTAAAPSTAMSAAAPGDFASATAQISADVEGTVKVLCSEDSTSVAPSPSYAAMERLLGSVTNNGRFAALKGILAHLSSPVRGDPKTLGILLSPDETANGAITAYDVIMPAAERFCASVQEPETRFMAIQTVDAVVRHVSAVLSYVVEHKAATSGAAGHPSVVASAGKKVKRPRRKGGEGTEGVEFDTIPVYCVPSAKLHHTLQFATQLLMHLWDDNTQQVSGALGETYNEILHVNECLKHCEVVFGTTKTPGDLIDTADTLRNVLGVQSERRGKYHALLSLMSVMPLQRFLEVLCTCYRAEASPKTTAEAPLSSSYSVDASVASLEAFCRMLLGGASSHKVGNVAGDVFAKMARWLPVPSVKTSKPPEASAGSTSSPHKQAEETPVQPPADALSLEVRQRLLRDGVLATLSTALTVSDYVPSPVNVSQTIAVSNLTAHFVTPLLKQDRAFLDALLDAVVARATTANRDRVNQSVVEILFRARNIGLDITAYLQPGSIVLPIMQESMQANDFEVRNTALGLCVLSPKKAEPVTTWQCLVVEEYVSLNLHLGGDSTARKSLLETFRKWVRRLAESVTSQSNKARAATTPSAKAAATRNSGSGKDQREEEATESEDALSYSSRVLSHCTRCASLFAAHLGVTPEQTAGFSVERRVPAAACYRMLLQSVVEAFPAMVRAAHLRTLFVPSVVPALLTDLSDGWGQARATVKELLLLFCEHAAAVVFGSDEPALAAAQAEARAQEAYTELQTVQTYRNAEGAVARFIIFATLNPAARAEADASPSAACLRRLKRLETERRGVVTICANLGSSSGKAAYQLIQRTPLHGRLALCAELLTSATNVRQHGAEDAILEASDRLLECCCTVLRSCSALVGTESSAREEGEVVDCRGHVYDKTNEESDTFMRTVVNNTWLSIRVATLVVQRVIGLNKVDRLRYDTVRTMCYDLMHSLLATKHNGVMRCVRAALRTVTEALVRSREQQFYNLPTEMLNYLLGPEGVTSPDLSRMLRRSQGLPHALLAVLEAEDPTVPFFLFPKAIKRLLKVAASGGGGSEDGHPSSTAGEEVNRSQRSNALNVMKFIFENRQFADRAVRYIEEAFTLSTEGFNNASWYIRNSSLMLFSSVLQRFVGEHTSTAGASSHTSLHDIAKRTPRGVAYAYRELIAGTAQSESPLVVGGIPNLALFPILQMLSMLTPDSPHLVTKATRGDGDDAAAMVGAVQRCAASKNLMVRSAGAVALSCLVPPAFVVETIRASATRLATSAVPLNLVHGTLLQWLQFTALYVGTMRRHCKVYLSHYATPALAQEVTLAVASALLHCRTLLHRSAATSPTIAANFFALVADVLYYGPGNGLTPTEADAVTELGVTVLREVVCAPTPAYQRIKADHGSAREAGARVLLLAFLRPLPTTATNSGTSFTAVTTSLQAIVGQEYALIRHSSGGSHNVLALLVEDLLYYSTAHVLLSAANVSQVSEALASLSCDVKNAVLLALQRALPPVAGDGAPDVPITPRSSVAWRELVALLGFVVEFVVTAEEAMTTIHEELLAQLETTLLAMLKQDSEAGGGLRDSEARCVAIRFVARRCAARGLPSAALVPILSTYAHPEQPVQIRHAVLRALSDTLPRFQLLRTSSCCPALCLILLRLLMDDTADIRREACVVTAATLSAASSSSTTVRDQMSSVLALVLALRRYAQAGELTSSDCQAYLLIEEEPQQQGQPSPHTADDANAESGSSAEEGELDEEGDDGDALFQKESANLFMEDTMLAYLVSRIMSSGSDGDRRGAVPPFTIFDTLLESASSVVRDGEVWPIVGGASAQAPSSS